MIDDLLPNPQSNLRSQLEQWTCAWCNISSQFERLLLGQPLKFALHRARNIAYMNTSFWRSNLLASNFLRRTSSRGAFHYSWRCCLLLGLETKLKVRARASISTYHEGIEAREFPMNQFLDFLLCRDRILFLLRSDGRHFCCHLLRS